MHTTVTSVRMLQRGHPRGSVARMLNEDESLVYIGMPGKAATAFGIKNIGPFGKPWHLINDQRGWEVAYREYLWHRLQHDAEFRDNVKALHGKTLVCWCKGKYDNADQPCHGDTLSRAVEWLNACKLD